MKHQGDYLITGATGLIGSHFLFELLQEILTEKRTSKIFLLVRATDAEHGLARIIKMLESEKAPSYLMKFTHEELCKPLVIIPSELNSPH